MSKAAVSFAPLVKPKKAGANLNSTNTRLKALCGEFLEHFKPNYEPAGGVVAEFIKAAGLPVVYLIKTFSQISACLTLTFGSESDS